MQFHQNYFKDLNPEARDEVKQPLSTDTPHVYSRITQNIGVAVFAVVGLSLSQVTMAVSLPQNIVSEINFHRISESNNLITPPEFTANRAFNDDPAPLVTEHDLNVRDNRLIGTSYADAQSQWGHTASTNFFNGGVLATSFYIANFTKDDDADVLTTRISNTHLEIRDFGSQDQGELVAGFIFTVKLLPGALDGTSPLDLNPATNPSLITAFDKNVSIKGRVGTTTGTSNDPFSGTFQLFGDHDIFTGDYVEKGFGTVASEARYNLDTVAFEIALDNFDTGQDFTVVWQATSQVVARGGETFADAQFWDPIGGTPGSFFEVGPSSVSPVPIPGAVLLFGTGLVGLMGAKARGCQNKT